MSGQHKSDPSHRKELGILADSFRLSWRCKFATISLVALAACGSGSHKDSGSRSYPATPVASRESSTRLSAEQTPSAAPAKIDEFSGQWVLVDHSSSGFPLYVDKSAIYPVGSDRKRADVMYLDNSGRMFERLTFDCKSRDVQALSDPIGQTDTAMPDLIGEFPREDPHLSARDYVCFGKISAPEKGRPIMTVLPAHM